MLLRLLKALTSMRSAWRDPRAECAARQWIKPSFFMDFSFPDVASGLEYRVRGFTADGFFYHIMSAIPCTGRDQTSRCVPNRQR